MNQPPNSPPWTMPARPAPHVCFGSNLSCSGCRPCPACLERVRSYVLPVAMAAAGFAGSREQAMAFFDAYTRAGWPRLHAAMHGELAGQFQIADIASLMGELEMYRAEARARDAAMNQSAAEPEASPPFAPPPGSAAFEPTLNGAMPPMPPEMVSPPSPPSPSPSAVKPLDAQDIAAAAVPASASPSPNGVSFGNVMHVPPGMEHHLTNGGKLPAQ